MPASDTVYPGLKIHGLFDSAIPATKSLSEITNICTQLCEQNTNEIAVHAAEGAFIKFGPPAFELYFSVKLKQLLLLSSLGEPIDQDLIKVYALLEFAKETLGKLGQNRASELGSLLTMTEELNNLKPTKFSPLELDMVAETLRIIEQMATSDHLSTNGNGSHSK